MAFGLSTAWGENLLSASMPRDLDQCGRPPGVGAALGKGGNPEAPGVLRSGLSRLQIHYGLSHEKPREKARDVGGAVYGILALLDSH